MEEKKNILEILKSEAIKENKDYNKFNKNFLSAWKKKAGLTKDLSILLEPIFGNIIDTISDYLLSKEELEALKEPKLYNEEVSEDDNIFKLDAANLYNVPYDISYFIGDSKEIATESLDKRYTITGLNKDVSKYYIAVYSKENNGIKLLLVLNGVVDGMLDVYADPKIDSDVVENIINAIFISSDLYVYSDYGNDVKYFEDAIDKLIDRKSCYRNDSEICTSFDQEIKRYKRLIALKMLETNNKKDAKSKL